MKTLGLLINPIAGMGGSVGLKGTDGMYQEAVRRGAVRKANARTALALKALLPIRDDLLVLCPSGEMGEDLAREMGFQVKVVYSCGPDTTAEDTIAAARAMADADLLLFAGGDGTYQYAVGQRGGDLRQLAREMNAALRGRGGGKPEFIQGTVAAGETEIRAFWDAQGAT